MQLAPSRLSRRLRAVCAGKIVRLYVNDRIRAAESACSPVMDIHRPQHLLTVRSRIVRSFIDAFLTAPRRAPRA